MADPGTTSTPPNKKSHMALMLILLAALVVILGIYYVLAFTKQGKSSPGNTEAKPGTILLLPAPTRAR